MKSIKRAAMAGALATTALAGLSTQALSESITLQWQSSVLTEAQYAPVWQAMVAEFEAQNPDIKIEPILVPRADNWTKFVTAAQARQAPCVVVVPVPTAAYNGYLLPLDQFWDNEPEAYRAVWPETALGVVTFDEQLYGLPFYAGIYGEVYNRSMVEAAGLDPDNPPQTWDEYLEWAQALRTDDTYATVILGGPTETTTRLLLSWIHSNGGSAFNEDLTEATFASNPKSLEAIKFYLGLASEHDVVPEGAATTNYAEQTVLFAQEKIGTMRNAYWGIAKVLGDNAELEDDIIVAPVPGNSPDAHTSATVTTVSISSNCEHPEEAWEFIKFMNEPQWAVQMVSTSNWMPLRNDLLDHPAVAGDPIVQEFLKMGSTALTLPLPTPAWSQIARVDVVEAVQRAIQEPDRVEEIFTELDVLVTQRLNDY